MKSFIAILTVFLAQQSFACIDYASQVKICPGETVYKGSSYSSGATILGVNQFKNTVTVRSNYSGNNNTENVTDLYITRGCIGHVCVGNVVYKGSSYSSGATVLAINPHQGTVTVKSNYSGNLNVEYSQGVDLVRGCLYGICVGDTVYKGSSYSSGATVIAINYQNRTVTVKSNYSGNLNVEDPRNLDVTNMCADYGQDYRQQSMSLP